MTIYHPHNLVFILTLNLIIVSCAVTDSGLTQKRIVIKANRSHIYKIKVPTGDTGVSKIFGGHGHSFGVHYKDSSFIYFTNDTYVATPNYFDNYKIISFTIPIGGLQADTTIGGRQLDGKYWKEIFHDGYYLGYKNVTVDKVELFDKSIMSFSRKK